MAQQARRRKLPLSCCCNDCARKGRGGGSVHEIMAVQDTHRRLRTPVDMLSVMGHRLLVAHSGTSVTPRPIPRETARMKRLRRAKPSMEMTYMAWGRSSDLARTQSDRSTARALSRSRSLQPHILPQDSRRRLSARNERRHTLMPETQTFAKRNVVMPPRTQSGIVVTCAATRWYHIIGVPSSHWLLLQWNSSSSRMRKQGTGQAEGRKDSPRRQPWPARQNRPARRRTRCPPTARRSASADSISRYSTVGSPRHTMVIQILIFR